MVKLTDLVVDTSYNNLHEKHLRDLMLRNARFINQIERRKRGKKSEHKIEKRQRLATDQMQKSNYYQGILRQGYIQP